MSSRRFGVKGILAIIAALVVGIIAVAQLPRPSLADPVEFQNVKVDATASGPVNGPWTLTFKAEQTRAPQDGEVNFGSDAEIKVSLAGVLDSAKSTVTVSPSDSGATATLNNDQLTVTGYDYGANIGSPLTITISDVAVDDWNLNQNNNIAAGVETSVDAISGIKWFKADGEGHYVEFPAPIVKVVKLAAANPAWNGKTVSWDAVTGADGYKVTYMGGSAGTKTVNTTNTSIDLSSYIDKDGNYSVRVEPTCGAHVGPYGYTYKRFHRITATPSYKENPYSSAYQAGTDGGTVSGSTKSGTAFSNIPTTSFDYMPGAIEALVGEGDEVTITATPATDYTGKLYQANAEVTSPYTFTVESAQYHSFNARFDKIPPDPVTVILEVGKGHEALAKKISDAAEAKGYAPTLEGTTLTMTKFPVLDEHGDAVTVNSGANDVIYKLVRTAFGSSFGYWRDNGEELIDTALKTIENYDSEEAIYDEFEEATDPIADGQKYYLLWAKPATKATLTIEKPICGTQVKQDPYEDFTVNAPVITAADDSEVIPYKNNAYWVGDGGWPVDELTFKGGEDYTAKTGMRPKFGFFIDENKLPQVTVTNAKSTDISELPHALDITVTADHDWDEGEVTTPATVDAEGEKTYKCKHFDTCGGKKTESIPKLITVTLIPSAMDGSKVGDPVVLTIPKGYSLDSYLYPDNRYVELLEQFENMNEGYYPLWEDVFVTDKPYSKYSSEADVAYTDEKLFYKALTEGTTFYVPMDKFIEELDVTVERPMAGTQVSVQTDDGSVQDGAKGLPTITISDDKVARNYELPYWVTDGISKNDYDKPFNGTIQARKDYRALLQLEPKLGWVFKMTDDPSYVTINGEAVDTVLFGEHYYRDILGKVPSDFTYNLYVGGVHVTDSNKDDVLGDGTVKFDSENVKLTLNNANIEISRREDGDDKNEYGIRSNLNMGSVTIELLGDNTISDSTDDAGTVEKYGIFVAQANSVTYTGNGTLSVSMPNADTATRYRGLEHRQSVTVDGVDISIDIDGSVGETNGIRMLYSNTFSLINGANVLVDVASGYAFDNNVKDKGDLSVEEGCVFEAISSGTAAVHGQGYVLPDAATKELGAYVNENPTETGRKGWDGTTDLGTYKYVRIPGIPTVTVNYDLGAGHETLAQADALKTAIEKRHGMKVLGVEGSVVKIKVPELSPNNTKNTVARLLGALQVALNESVGHDPWYGPYWVYDQDQWNFNNALKTIENYSSYDEVNQESEDAEASKVMPTDGQTIYALWAEPISEVAIDVEAPLCGTEVTADLRDPENPDMGYDEETQTPQPVVSTSTEHVSIYEEDGWEYTWWVDQTRKEEAGFTIVPPCYTGTMEGNQDYMMVVTVEPDFGYYLPEDVKFTTSNGTVDEKLSHGIDSFADAYVTVTAEHEIEKVDEVPATCTEDGTKEHWACKHCDKLFEDEEGTTEITADDIVIPATEHDWGEPTYTWADDNKTVTAKRVCKNDADHVETETADVSAEETQPASCDEMGTVTYTSDAFENPAFEVQTKTVDVPAKNHDWGEPSYEWADNHSSVTAKRVCKNNPDHVENETVAATSEVTKKADCKNEGVRTFTSKAFENEAFAVQTATETIPVDPKAHDWGEWSVTREATETEEGEEERTCKICGEKETRTIPAKDHEHGLTKTEAKDASCTEPGNTEYWTCTEGENPCGRYFADAEGTEEIEKDSWVIPAKDHAPKDPVRENVVDASCTEPGSYDEVVYCSECEEELSRTHVDVPALGHNWGEWVVTREATEDAEGEEERTCKRCGEVEKRAIPKVTYYDITYVLAGGNVDGDAGPIVETHAGGEQIAIMRAPTREGYTFQYWEGSRYNPGDAYTVTEDHTFTAVWQKDAEPEPKPDDKPSGKVVPKTGGDVAPARSALPETGDVTSNQLAVLFGAAGAALITAASRRKREE